jgi:hypothetical protein
MGNIQKRRSIVGKVLLMMLVAFLVSCGHQPSSLSNPVSTTTTVVADMGPKPENQVKTRDFSNKLVEINSSNFVSEIENTINIVEYFQPELSVYLESCEIGYTNSEGYEVVSRKSSDTCIILFVPKEMAKESQRFSMMDVSSGSFIVGMTQDVIGTDYPFIFIAEGTFDSFYFSRVLAHEGFHMINIRNGTDCISDPVCEEVNAYQQVTFSMLESMLPAQLLSSGYQSYSLEGASEMNLRALEMEHDLYLKNKEGKLSQYLVEIGYGN